MSQLQEAIELYQSPLDEFGCTVGCDCVGGSFGEEVNVGSENPFPWLTARVSGSRIEVGAGLGNVKAAMAKVMNQPGKVTVANPLGLSAAQLTMRVHSERKKVAAHPTTQEIAAHVRTQPPAELALQKKRAAASTPVVLANRVQFADASGHWVLTPGQYKVLTDHAIWWENGKWYHRGIEIPSFFVPTDYRIIQENNARAAAARNKPGFFKKLTRSIKTIPGLGHIVKAADSVLNSTVVNAIQAVLNNPIVSTVFGQFVVPANLLLSTAKGGPSGALEFAKKELNNPVRAVAIKAIALVFPPLLPAAAGLETARRVVDAMKSKDPVEAMKGIAQVAATTALAELGDVGAIKALDVLTKVKAVTDTLPQTPFTPTANSRVQVCGARSDEARGVWLKTHIYQDGEYMRAVVYSVANGNAEVLNLKVDLRPLVKAVTAYHQKLHGNGPLVGSALNSVANTAKKLGRGKLANAAFETSKRLAAKAACNMQAPNVPVSNAALTVFAAARKGVDAVDRAKKFNAAAAVAAKNLQEFTLLKARLAPLSQAQRAQALRNPTYRAILMRGLKSKADLANFVKTGGIQKAQAVKATASIASQKFARLNAALRSGSPLVKSRAQTMAKAVTIAAKARAATSDAVANNRGGLPGIVIDSRGRIRKSGKSNKFFTRRVARSGEASQVLIPRSGPIQTGVFDQVAGGFSSNSFDPGPFSHGQFSNADESFPGAEFLTVGRSSRARLAQRLKAIRKQAVVNGDFGDGAFTFGPFSHGQFSNAAESFPEAEYLVDGDFGDGAFTFGEFSHGQFSNAAESLPSAEFLTVGLANRARLAQRLKSIRRKAVVNGGAEFPFDMGVGGSPVTPSHSDVRSPTRTDVRSPTRTRTEVRSPTSTSTEVRSPTSTSTEAYTQGNFTLTATGGAGAGATHVTVNLPGYPAGHQTRLVTPPPNGVFDHISDPRPPDTGIFDNVGASFDPPPATPADLAFFANIGAVRTPPLRTSQQLLQRLSGIRRIANIEQTTRERLNAIRRMRIMSRGKNIIGGCHIGGPTDFSPGVLWQADYLVDGAGNLKKKPPKKKVPVAVVKAALKKLPPVKRVAVVAKIKLAAVNKKAAQRLIALKVDAAKRLAASKARGESLEHQLAIQRQALARQAALQKGAVQLALRQQTAAQEVYDSVPYTPDEEAYDDASMPVEETDDEEMDELSENEHDHLDPETYVQDPYTEDLPADMPGGY